MRAGSTPFIIQDLFHGKADFMESIKTRTIDTWLEMMAEATKKFSVISLGLEEGAVQMSKPVNTPPKGLSGAFLTMVSLDDTLQLGMASNKNGCKSISGALMGMTPRQMEALSNEDIVDAMGEVVNIIAGMVKTKMENINPRINIGLPVFLTGNIEPSHQQEAGAIEIKIGDVKTQIVVIRQKNPSHS